MGNMAGGDNFACFFAMTRLIIEKHIGSERLKKCRLFQAAEKQRLIQTDIPFAQGADHPFMGGRRAGGDQRCPNRAGSLGEFAL